jgi:hypothetical protein
MPENEDTKSELEKFIYDNPELEELEEIVGEFNIFTALNIENNEIRHSTFLSWLLDPSESHGLGDYFLSLFLKEVVHKAYSMDIDTPSVFDIDSWDFDDAEIIREWRNIDILIKSDYHKFVCVIENKVYSTEHSDQLNKYWKIIQNEFPAYSKLFVYLTVDGEEPSNEEDKEHYVSFSHGDIVIIIEHLIKSKKEKLGTAILTFISHYKDMLRRYIMQDSKVQDLCIKIYKKHKKALDLIFENKPDKLMEIYECLKEIIKADEENLTLDYSTKSIIRFIPRSLDFMPLEGNWLTSKRMLIFELINNTKDLILCLAIYPGPKEIRDKIHSLAHKDRTLFNMVKDKHADRFTGIYKKQILRLSEHEDKDIKEIKELLKERIQDFKENDLPKIVNVMKQFEVS